jgi:DNA-binding HxlR family transcriptional regulator
MNAIRVNERGRDGALNFAIDLLGDRWILLLVSHALYHGATRFKEFEQQLNIPSNMLAARLRKLTAVGVIERHPCRLGRSPHEYRLTELGSALEPALQAFADWAELTDRGKDVCERHL